ncbi:MAG: T9SS type A sorting domain-containing protein [Candidatus Kapabacteria bacterium]|nr:T9SS type A sorting domain-containing protein [Candidatus Kapabacteria bacterium]
MKKSLFVIIILTVVAPLLMAQVIPVPTTCLESSIYIPRTSSWSTYIPYCMDTLRIGRLPPFPPSGTMPIGSCAELYEVTRPGGVPTYRRIPAEVVCEWVEHLLVIPLEKLEADYDQPPTRTYVVRMYCEYWQDNVDDDTTELEFRVAPAFTAYARAVDVATGEEITAGQLVQPTHAQRAWLNTGEYRIDAWDEYGYEFLYWKCDFEEIPLDPTERSQTITTRCWQVGTATVFTAFFRRKATSVETNSDVGIRIRHHDNTVIVESTDASTITIALVDVAGQQMCTRSCTQSRETISLTDLAPGIYFCIVRTGSSVHHLSIHHY